MWYTVGEWGVWCLLAVCAVWMALRFLPAGTDGINPIPYLIALIPFLWVPIGLCVIASSALRLWPALAMALLLLMVLAALRLPHHRRRFRRRPAHISDTAPSIGVMTVNCRFGRADADAIVSLVGTRRISILALQEMTDELALRLSRAGLDSLLPHHSLGRSRPGDNGGFNGIWTDLPVIDATDRAIDMPAADVPGIVVDRGGRRLLAVSAHPKSPMRGCREWSDGIIALGGLAVGTTDDVLVMGDLNSNLDHPSFRALMRAGFRDASLTQAQGATLTFPRWLRWPRIELDHVLVTDGLTPYDPQAVPVPGTDHLALTARLMGHEDVPR